jgi:DNA-binding LacI/PurR family transcriptional regulator
MSENITIYDIAKEAKVSPATVSRVLTGSANVRPEKRDAILAIIEKYNYRPNALARSLINKASKTIGFILPDITNPFFAATFLEAEKHALTLGYTLILCNSMNDNLHNQTELESLYLKMLMEKQVDGIIIMGGRVNEKRPISKQVTELQEISRKTPLVFINGNMKGVKSYNIITDEVDGINKLVQYLVNLGHKNIGFIGGRKGITATEVKLSAFESTIKQLDLDYHPEWIIPSSFGVEDGYASMVELLSMRNRPTAVMTVNDFTAIGAINAAVDFGLQIPEDISITGFDGTHLTDMTRPTLTTVSQNYAMLGQKAIEAISTVSAGKKFPHKTIVPTQLLIKNSCQKISLR